MVPKSCIYDLNLFINKMSLTKEFKTVELDLSTYGNFSAHSVHAVVNGEEFNNGFRNCVIDIVTFSFKNPSTLLIGYYLTYDVNKVQ